MHDRIDSVVSTLEAEEQQLLSQKADLDRQASELDAALRRIKGALKALGAASSAKSETKKAPAKPSPDKAVVREAVLASLQGKTLKENELRTDVEQFLAERGFSRMGLSLRLKEVLREESLTESPDGYQLTPLQESDSLNLISVHHQKAADSA